MKKHLLFTLLITAIFYSNLLLAKTGAPLGPTGTSPDDCASAVAPTITQTIVGGCDNLVTLGTPPLIGSSQGATPSGIAIPGCWPAGTFNPNDVWYRYDKPAGVLSFDVRNDITDLNDDADADGNCDNGTLVKTYMAVYSGTCGGLTLEGCDNGTADLIGANACPGTSWSKVSVASTSPAQTYYIRMVTQDALPANSRFYICVEEKPTPITCSNPFVSLSSLDIPYSTDNCSNFKLCNSGNDYISPKPNCTVAGDGWIDTEEQVIKFTTNSPNEQYNLSVFNNSAGCQSNTNCGRDRYTMYVLKKCPSDPSFDPATDCIGYTSNNGGGTAPGVGINVTFPLVGDYFIVINNKSATDPCTGSDDFPVFNISTIITAPPANNSCTNPIVVSPVFKYSTTTCGAGNNHNASPSCLAFPTSHFNSNTENVFRFQKTTTTPEYFNLTLNRLPSATGSESFSIAMFGPYPNITSCPAAIGTAPTNCLATSSPTMGNTINKLSQVLLPSAGYYYIYIQRSFTGACGAYTLTSEVTPSICNNITATIPTVTLGNPQTTGLQTTCGKLNIFDNIKKQFLCGGSEMEPTGFQLNYGNTCDNISLNEYSNPDAVYTYTPTISQKLRVSFNSSTDGYLWIYDGCPYIGLGSSLLAKGFTNESLNGSPVWADDIQFDNCKTYYFIYTHTPTNGSCTNTKCGEHQITLTDNNIPALDGVNCCNPLTITSFPFTKLNFNTLGYRSEYEGTSNNPGACLYNNDLNLNSGLFPEGELGEDMVFEYTPTTDECIKITYKKLGQPGIAPSGYSNVGQGFRISEGCPNEPNSQCKGIYTAGGTLNSVVGFASLTANKTYYILVSSNPGPGVTPGNCTGGCDNKCDLKIELCDEPTPANNLACNAQTVSLGETVYGDNIGAINDGYGHSSCFKKDGTMIGAINSIGINRWGELNPVWYKLVAPAGGSVNIKGQTEILNGEYNCNNIFTKFQAALYQGANCTSLTQIGGRCDDSRINDICYALGTVASPTGVANTFGFTASGLTPGQTYFLRIDGIGNNQGRFSFEVVDQAKINCIRDFQDCIGATNICKQVTTIAGGYAGQGLICDIPYWQTNTSNAAYTNQTNFINNSSFGQQTEKNAIWFKFRINATGGTLKINIKSKTKSFNPSYFALFDAGTAATSSCPQVNFVPLDFNNSINSTFSPIGVAPKSFSKQAIRSSNAYSFFENLTWPDPTADSSQNWRGLRTTESNTDFNETNSFATNASANGYTYTVNAPANTWYYLLVMNQWGSGKYPLEIDFLDSPVLYDVTSKPTTLTWFGVSNSNWFDPANWDSDANPATPNCWIPDRDIDVIIPAPSSTSACTDVVNYTSIGDSITFAVGSTTNGIAECKNISFLNGTSAILSSRLFMTQNSRLDIWGNLVTNGVNTRFYFDLNSIVSFSGNVSPQLITLAAASADNAFGTILCKKSSNILRLNNTNPIDINNHLIVASAELDFNGRTVLLGGDFENYATTNATAINSNLTFDGINTQYFTNLQISLNFYRVTINKPSNPLTPTIIDTLKLNNHLDIRNRLTLTRGFINTFNLEVDVTSNATNSVIGYSSNSFIIGNLRRRITSTNSYDFPVGDIAKNYHLANITFTSNADITNLLARFDPIISNPSPNSLIAEAQGLSCPLLANIANPLDNGEWTISSFNGTGRPYTSTTSTATYTATLNNQNYTNANAFHKAIMKDGILAGNPSVACATNPNLVTRNGFSGFSKFATAQVNDQPLPINFLSVKGQFIYPNNVIEWIAENNKEIEGFEIWRGLSPINMTKIDFVESGNKTNQTTNYNYWDENVEFNTRYYYKIVYRSDLEKISSNTIAIYTGIVSDNIKAIIYPNPVIDNFAKLSIEAPVKEKITIKIVNNLGVETNIFQNKMEYNLIMDLNLANYKAGVYFVIIKSESINKTIKMIVN